MTEDRRAPDRLADSDLEVKILPNHGGGVIVKVTHRRLKRFASATHVLVEEARRKAIATLARNLGIKG